MRGHAECCGCKELGHKRDMFREVSWEYAMSTYYKWWHHKCLVKDILEKYGKIKKLERK